MLYYKRLSLLGYTLKVIKIVSKKNIAYRIQAQKKHFFHCNWSLKIYL